MTELYELKKYHKYSYEDLINLILELEKEKEDLKKDIERYREINKDLNKDVESMNHGRADCYGSSWK